MPVIDDVAIGNRCLSKLGDARISSFDDQNKAAREMKGAYAIIRDAELRRRKWRFSLARTSLAELLPVPEFGYGHQFQLPADCLQVVSAGDVPPGTMYQDLQTSFDTAEYSIEGRSILTDQQAPLKLRYKRRITDPALFDISFVEAFACRLAWELCESITGKTTRKDDCRKDYRIAIGEAVRANAIESPREQLQDDSWLQSRHAHG